MNSIDQIKYESVREWGGYIIGSRRSVGSAARCNRGAHSGSHVHALIIEDVIGIKGVPHPNSIGARFLKLGRPVQFSARPVCGCTSGQNAAKERVGAMVTCSKCGGGQ